MIKAFLFRHDHFFNLNQRIPMQRYGIKPVSCFAVLIMRVKGVSRLPLTKIQVQFCPFSREWLDSDCFFCNIERHSRHSPVKVPSTGYAHFRCSLLLTLTEQPKPA